MDLISGIVVFVITWWMVLFAVLPWGVRRSAIVLPGNEPGAPENPRLKRKAVYTTLVTILVWCAIDALISSNLISFHDLAMKPGLFW